MGGSTARGVVLGAITTAATFYAFLITDFTGLYQMGLIVGTGVLFCLLAVLFLVPAMIGWSEEHHSKRESEPRLHIFAFGIEHLTRARHPDAARHAGGRGAGDDRRGGGGAAAQVRRQRRVAAAAGQSRHPRPEEINSHFGSGFESMSLVLKAPTLPEVLALADKAADRGRRLVADGRLGGVDAVTVGAAAAGDPAGGARLARAWSASGRLDMTRIRAAFAAALAQRGAARSSRLRRVSICWRGRSRPRVR